MVGEQVEVDNKEGHRVLALACSPHCWVHKLQDKMQNNATVILLTHLLGAYTASKIQTNATKITFLMGAFTTSKMQKQRYSNRTLQAKSTAILL